MRAILHISKAAGALTMGEGYPGVSQLQLVQSETLEEDDMYDDAILLGEKLMVVRTCLDPDTLLTVDKDMEDAAAFAFEQVMNAMLNDDESNQPEKLSRNVVLTNYFSYP